MRVTVVCLADSLLIAKTGGSAVNRLYFGKGSKADYDAWQELGNKGWGWEGLLP
jgi:choline dehydrogenase-like flavoprotein